jgi:hypothetical protein
VTTRSRLALRRRCGTALTLLYLLGTGFAPLMHAWAERDSPPSAETHLHAPGTDCPPPHDEQHCPTCQFAGLKILSGTPCQLPTAALRRAPDLIVRTALPAARRLLLTRGPRAPPPA